MILVGCYLPFLRKKLMYLAFPYFSIIPRSVVVKSPKSPKLTNNSSIYNPLFQLFTYQTRFFFPSESNRGQR